MLNFPTFLFPYSAFFYNLFHTPILPEHTSPSSFPHQNCCSTFSSSIKCLSCHFFPNISWSALPKILFFFPLLLLKDRTNFQSKARILFSNKSNCVRKDWEVSWEAAALQTVNFGRRLIKPETLTFSHPASFLTLGGRVKTSNRAKLKLKEAFFITVQHA